MIMFNTIEERNKALMYRDWGRIGNNSEDMSERFGHTVDGIEYDFKFLYGVLGYNMKSTEMNAAFGIVHLFQGWRSAGLVVLVALRDHIVVGLTGTLFVAIVVHMLHDAIFGTVSSRRVRRDERAVEAAAEGARAIS